jgi:cyclic beta-1,2-glucan synthetase
LPRLALLDGIDAGHRVIVVIPSMLTHPNDAQELAHRLELHYLANPEREAQFALLTDWADADTAQAETDQALLVGAMDQIEALNARHPIQGSTEDISPRFILLHRTRRFSQSEQRWIGWERKRGKIEQLVRALVKGHNQDFLNLGPFSRIASEVKYIVTLDSDTQLPPGRLRELVGVAAHPHNQPILAADGRSVVSGYGILQPRLVTPLPSSEKFTLFHWLFAGQNGIDPYCIASSEVYQDLFSEGSFTGKGLIHVREMYAVLCDRLPQDQVLSHDLLEGALMRCAAITDITIIEDAPFHADVAASRIHRGTRGDWQLLPFLFAPARYRLRAINCWKMFDNLRRSLVAPMSLALLLLSLSGLTLSTEKALVLVLTAFCAGPLMGSVAGFFPHKRHIAKLRFYRQACVDLLRTVLGSLWQLTQLLQHAMLAADAILRALFRLYASHRHLLQWTSAAAAQTQARSDLSDLIRQHWLESASALCLLFISLNTQVSTLSVILFLVWGASPLWTWVVSRAHPIASEPPLCGHDQDYLEGIARDTWRFFERCVGVQDHFLPPDNLQVIPNDMVAHRTSPTNIGLYLLSATCAKKFGWIGTQEMLERLESTLDTLATLERYRGHFLNWYDTKTCQALLPSYVSTVDSGNLAGHMLAVAQACREFALHPVSLVDIQRGLRFSRKRLDASLSAWPELAPDLSGDSALARLLALESPLDVAQQDILAMQQLIGAAVIELKECYDDTEPTRTLSNRATALAWQLHDYLTTLRSACNDIQASLTIPSPGTSIQAMTAARLQQMAIRCERLGWEADFSFLHHPKRHLLHIGFRIAEQQLDAGFYDLLASESRLTSLLAIAKGDAPVRHWGALGRPFFSSAIHAGLRSWSGSMFEYLMPGLILEEPHASALYEASHVALCEQIALAQVHGIPWGISESAYATRDQTLAYQYAPQGVARLALRRTPVDELVIAPYATALATQISPQRGYQNFVALEALGARARYGFMDAIDFTPQRQEYEQRFTLVGTFMAHHQGMSIVALTNVLFNGCVQRWGMATPQIEAVISLLHERAPREISAGEMPPMTAPSRLQATPQISSITRQRSPKDSELEPTHLLSNGRYHVRLRSNGAGTSHWGQTCITRSRDDALRDAYGNFFYVRRLTDSNAMPTSSPVSITQHPAHDPSAQYASTFHVDRVCFSATWPDLHTHQTVWVSPEDDIELRQLELSNLTDQPMEFEVISAFEVALSDARADEAHPAFMNLFVQAHWERTHQALVLTRTPRLANEQSLSCAHFLTDQDAHIIDIRYQTDRQLWSGRNQRSSQPFALFQDVPADPDSTTPDLNTGLDPVCALAVRLQLAPRAKAQLTFATAVSNQPELLRTLIDKYRQPSSVQRASLLSATLANIRIHALTLSAENFSAIQLLTTSLVFTLSQTSLTDTAGPSPTDPSPTSPCDRRLLWRLGISGDRPLLVIQADSTQSLGMVRALTQAMSVWSWAGVACDLIIISAEPASYLMPLQHELNELRNRYLKECATLPLPAATSFHILRSEEISSDERATLHYLSRVFLIADGRSLSQEVQRWAALHTQAGRLREATPVVRIGTGTERTPLIPASASASASAPTGTFTTGSGEFNFEINQRVRPQRPWINVLSNPDFGTQISETGAGYTWAINSRLNQLTAWSNDPVTDQPCEWLILQDMQTRQAWCATPNAWGDADTTYEISHGQGYSRIAHRRGPLTTTVTWCVDPTSHIKQILLDIKNSGAQTEYVRLTGVVEWMMGERRSDRQTVLTNMCVEPLLTQSKHTPPEQAILGEVLTTLLCTQREVSAGFGGGCAFLTLIHDSAARPDWTCDRRELFDACGDFVLPDHFGKQQGAGLDPCAALSTHMALESGAHAQRVFLLGYGANAEAAKDLARHAASKTAEQRLSDVHSSWDQLLSATQVSTPDPLFDVLVNRWLLYQTVSCRMWAKAGFYQAGGATGFRDQLQDALALSWAAPELLRTQILICAAHQFIEGDVMHWWHAPAGTGVRTHISDDLLWLAYACSHYVRTTADLTVLEEILPFVEGIVIAPGAEDAYATPVTSHEHATVYEHAARAIDLSLRTGSHGLPLIGSGDWNDGLNRVGHEGQGESVWLGWFLCQVVADFAPLAKSRGETARAERWLNAAQGWHKALATEAWDGQWYKRAFFDQGQAFGSKDNPQARIDLVAQVWAVLSNVAPPARQDQALAAVEQFLVDHEAGLIKLLDPPLSDALPSAGYVQAYPPGVRENGGQYSHAAVWALMAQAQTRTRLPASAQQARADTVFEYFTFLSPAHRATHPTRGAHYGLEPYVMAGDVYSHAPYTGRGGWSWYTGSAAWMHRAAIESILGLHQEAATLSLTPCLPAHWTQAELTLRRDDQTIHFVLLRLSDQQTHAACKKWNASLLRVGQALAWHDLPADSCFVIALERVDVPLPGAATATATSSAAPDPDSLNAASKPALTPGLKDHNSHGIRKI